MWGMKSAVELDCAALHLAHGLRPMQINENRFAFVLAQRKSVFIYLRTAHCLRGHYIIYFPLVKGKIFAGLGMEKKRPAPLYLERDWFIGVGLSVLSFYPNQYVMYSSSACLTCHSISLAAPSKSPASIKSTRRRWSSKIFSLYSSSFTFT